MHRPFLQIPRGDLAVFPARPLLLVLIAALALSGCGRRGALEEPGRPEPALTTAPNLVPIAPNSAAAGELSTLDPGSPGAQEPAEGGPAATAERRFFLDGLL